MMDDMGLMRQESAFLRWNCGSGELDMIVYFRLPPTIQAFAWG